MSTTPMEQKIKALLNKAESTHSAEEAQAFTAKAEELMLKHAIDQARLVDPEVRDEEIIRDVFPYLHTGSRWKSLGVMGAGTINAAIGLTGLAINNKSKTITLYGRKADCDHVRLVIQSAWRQAEAHLARWRKLDAEYKFFLATKDWPNYYRALDSFVYGFCEGAAAKISAAKEEYLAKDVGAELVLVSAMDQVDEAMSDLRKTRMRDLKVTEKARSEGYLAGRGANLSAELQSH